MHRDGDELGCATVDVEIRIDFREFDDFCIDQLGGELDEIQKFARAQADRIRSRSARRVR